MSTPDQVQPEKSLSRAGEVDLLLAVADELETLALSLDHAGHPSAGHQLHGAASAIDVALPQPDGWWTGAFNGGAGRRQIFLQILKELAPKALLETGTFRGTTTAFMAQHFSGPIFTCEANPRWFLTAKANLSSFQDIDIRNQDSRQFLRAILSETEVEPLFIYLDAHWTEDLPLPEELALILASGIPAAIMIDDFAVPWDPGYAYDDYGPGKALTIELLARLNPQGASLFFPTIPATQETGAKRGCAVIGIGDQVIEILYGLAELKHHDWPTMGDPVQAAESLQTPAQDLKPLRRLVAAPAYEAEREALVQRAEAAAEERDAFAQRAEVAAQERDAFAQQAEVAAQERDALAQRAVAAAQEHEALVQRAEATAQQLDALRRQRRVAFIDHSYHKKTLSTVFLRECLFPDQRVDDWWDESWRGGSAVDAEWLAAQGYDLIVVTQVEVAAEALARLGCKNVVFIPMWDSCRLLPEAWWRALEGFRIISFCTALHERVRNYGLPSIYVQYYPDPTKFQVVSDYTGLRGFFWQRHHDLTWRHVVRLASATPEHRLHIHLAQDPGAEDTETPSPAEQEKYQISLSKWFERKQDYHDRVAHSNVYFAPRPSEGIGFSLLEAMAMGMCVVAPNAPTMNEYITHEVTGLLWNLADPRPLDFSQAAELGRRAREKVVTGHQKWLSDLPKLREFVDAPISRASYFGDSARFRGGSNASLDERSRIRNSYTASAPLINRHSTGGLRTRGIAKQDLAQLPLITVVTATLNCIDQFEGTIRNILNQDYPNLEVMVFDGGSSDGTLDLIAKYDDLLDYWTSGKDDGTYFAMNHAAELANGRYVLFMNAGDWFFGEDAISRAMLNVPLDADFIIGHHIYRQLEGDEIFRKANSFDTTWESLTSGALDNAWLGGVPCHQATLTRTSLLREDHYDTQFRIAADHEFMYRQRCKGARFYNCDEFLSVYTGGGLSAKAYLRTLDEWIAITSKYGSTEAAEKYFGPERKAVLAGKGSQDLRGQIRAAEERAEHFRAEAESYRVTVEALRASTSWRITGPLRKFRRLFS